MKENGLEKALAAVKALRGEGGCPWDRAQTHESLRPFLLEETYEVLEALDERKDKGDGPLREELGDLLFQVLLHSEIARERGAFDIHDVAGDLAAKLVRRHPHVFSENKLETPEEVIEAWQKTKEKEKPKESRLDGIPPALPALQRGLKVIEKVSGVGFQWPDISGPLEKVEEELGEFRAELGKLGPATSVKRERPLPAELKDKLEAELGDLLFSLANVAYFLNLNPEDALRSMLGRFERRFRYVEKRAKETGRELKKMSLEEMDELWDEAKRRE